MGRGAHGTVWRAWDPARKQWVAVKVFSGRGGEEGAWRFMREQRLDIEHPSIIEVLDFGSDSAGSHLVTELLPHGTLEDYTTERGALAPDLVLTWGAQLLDAVAAIAAAGVVHRDIKPSNVMLRDEPDGPRAVLVDFGQAWVADGAELTTDQGPVGTRGFTPPEYADPLAPPTPAGDVYALGVTLRRAVTGGVDAAGERVPPELMELIDRLCAPEPDLRPRADEAAAAWRAVAAERRAAGIAPTGRAGLPPRVASPPDPYRRRKVGAGLAFAVAVNATALWAISQPDPPSPPRPAGPDEVAWADATGPIAVADDGTVYSADVEQGIVYRHDGHDLVPVAGGGGGDDADGGGPARDVDLSSALRLASPGDPADTYVPGRWELVVGRDGALWLNTGEIWRIEPGGRARRVLAVEPKPGDQVAPYRIFSRDVTESASTDGQSVFDATMQITALPSPMRPRGNGVDVVDATDDRIVHVDADGTVRTACDLRTTRIGGLEPDGLSTNEDGQPVAADRRSLLPSSFVVTRVGACWVVDSATGEIAQVVDGTVRNRFFGRPGEAGATEVADAAPGWTSTPTPLVSPVDSGADRSAILGVTSTGSVLLHLGGSGVTGTIGAIEPGSSMPNRTAWFSEVDDLYPDRSIPAGAGARLAMSPDGEVLVGLFTSLSAPTGSDPRIQVPATSLGRFAVDDLFKPDALRLPDAIAAATDRPPTYDVAAALAGRTIDASMHDPAAGDRTDQIRFVDISPSTITATSEHFVASVSGDPWLWQFRPRPNDRLRFLALLDQDAGSEGSACRVRDLAVAPDGGTVAVLCSGDTYSILGIDRTADGDAGGARKPKVLVSAEAFDRAAKAWGTANDVENLGFGPGLRLLYRPDGRLLLASEDEGTIYEVEQGRLKPLTGLAQPTSDPLDRTWAERLKGIEDDPVLVAITLRRWWTDLAGGDHDRCSRPSGQRSAFVFRDAAIIGDEGAGRLVLSTSRCLLEVTPDKGTQPFAPGRSSAGLTRLAGGEGGLLAYDPVDSTIWRYPADGGERELVAGRSGRRGVSPDGRRAAGSPIGGVTNLFWGPAAEPCFVEVEATSIRCVDERGALRTRAGLAVPTP